MTPTVSFPGFSGRRLSLIAGVAVLVAIAGAASAGAQVVTRRPAQGDEGPASTFVGGALMYASPQRDFKNYVSGAIGISGHLIHAFDPSRIVALRVEGGYLIYGQTTHRQPLGGGALGLINVDVTTSNNIVFGGIGLQLMAPTGVVRPYVAGSVGFSYFFTQSTIEGSNNSAPFADTQNFDDGGFTTLWGGGLYIPLGWTHGRPISLDLGAQVHTNNDIQYLTKNSITIPNASAPPVITPVRSAADFVTFRLGVSVGIR